VLLGAAKSGGLPTELFTSGEARRPGVQPQLANLCLFLTSHTPFSSFANNILKYPVEYRELGAGYLDRLHPERLKRKLVKRLEALGHKVIPEPAAQPA